MEVKIDTYEDLFNLWSTDVNFRLDYPYLPMLRNEFNLVHAISIKDETNKIELYLSGGIFETSLDKEDRIKYFYPYIKKHYVTNGKVVYNNIVNMFRNDSIIIQYILDTNTPIVITDTLNLTDFLLWVSGKQYQEIVKLGLFSQMTPEGTPFDVKNNDKFNLKLFYDWSGLECYKPSAYDVLKNYLDKYLHNWPYIIEMIEYINKNNCEWVSHPNEVYNYLKENNKITRDEMAEKTCINKEGYWSDYVISTNYKRFIIGYAKKYGYDLNKKTIKGAYLVHIAIRQNDIGWVRELLDNGATLFDNGRMLPIKNESFFRSFRGYHVREWVYDELIKYYKDQPNMIEIINKEYGMNVKSQGIVIKITKKKGQHPDWSIIQDETIRKKMMEKYMKLIC